ncbi:zinc finger protein 346 isoform X2 [Cephus cinctus]|uniref:Zinc finger protein 346 isoform X2 n=1 Tax=Cephus cinctus TaxID=211228 RepID=A0AAJ7W341_CEPCN|nr:zinc finger protein 346 isoform X2 [Cephus cinctus]XP_024942799.1 zinc finger protein 346 isoform X2 [Cephus cinctus]
MYAVRIVIFHSQVKLSWMHIYKVLVMQNRSKTIMATLEETKVAFTKDEETNGLKCNVCNVCLNSIQQLQTHLNGNRHKKKAMKGGWIGKDVVQLGTTTTTTTARTPSSTGNLDLATSTTGFAYSCDICNKFFNSQAQYDVHVASRKHIDKANGTAAAKNQRKKRFFPYWKRTKMDSSKMSHIQSLASNFVTGGYVNYM